MLKSQQQPHLPEKRYILLEGRARQAIVWLLRQLPRLRPPCHIRQGHQMGLEKLIRRPREPLFTQDHLPLILEHL